MTSVILPSCFVACVTFMCDITSHSLPKSKIKKSKIKTKIKIKENWKIKNEKERK